MSVKEKMLLVFCNVVGVLVSLSIVCIQPARNFLFVQIFLTFDLLFEFFLDVESLISVFFLLYCFDIDYTYVNLFVIKLGIGCSDGD